MRYASSNYSGKSLFARTMLFFFFGIAVWFGWANFSELRAQESMNSPAVENPDLKIPATEAYYKGKKVWFTYNEISDQEMANRLSKKLNHPIAFSSQLGKVSTENIGKLYVFTNGVSQKDKKPWGGGPFSYQNNIFDSIPGDEEYTPLREIHLVSWFVDIQIPRILKSEGHLIGANWRSQIKIRRTFIIVNAPIIKGPEEEVSWIETMLKKISLFLRFK